MQKDLDDRGLPVNPVFTRGSRLISGRSIAQTPQLLADVTRGNVDSRIDDLAVRVDLRGKLPLAPLELGLHHAAQVPYVPAPQTHSRHHQQKKQRRGDLDEPYECSLEAGFHGWALQRGRRNARKIVVSSRRIRNRMPLPFDSAPTTFLKSFSPPVRFRSISRITSPTRIPA